MYYYKDPMALTEQHRSKINQRIFSKANIFARIQEIDILSRGYLMAKVLFHCILRTLKRCCTTAKRECLHECNNTIDSVCSKATECKAIFHLITCLLLA